MRSPDVLLGSTLVPCCSDHLISTYACNTIIKADSAVSSLDFQAQCVFMSLVCSAVGVGVGLSCVTATN